MDFEKNVPEWNAQGVEPPASLKESGFSVGYKPPADYFNWFFSRVAACLTEIRTKLSGHAGNTSNPHNVTAAQVGLGNVNNTADSEKSVAYAQEAGVGRKVEYAMTIRLNGGRTESTDQFTYDGSTSRSVNITAEKIGAAEADMSNVDDATFLAKAAAAGVGLPNVAAVSTDGVTYTATVDGVTELYNGLIITITPNMTSTSKNIKLNVNGLGDNYVRLPLSTNTGASTTPKSANYYVAGRALTLQYDANFSSSGGAWKTLGKERPDANGFYGTLPIENGGHGATDAATARANLGITDPVSAITEGSTAPVTSGAVYTGLADKQNKVTYSTTDLTAGTSELADGEVYLVYE